MQKGGVGSGRGRRWAHISDGDTAVLGLKRRRSLLGCLDVVDVLLEMRSLGRHGCGIDSVVAANGGEEASGGGKGKREEVETILRCGGSWHNWREPELCLIRHDASPPTTTAGHYRYLQNRYQVPS